MVFKPFTHLARQSFAKTFTHGYVQSVVAATQSSYASSTTPFSPFGNHHSNRYVKPGVSHRHNAFHNASGSGAGTNRTGQTAHGADGADGGLSAYYDAWQKQQLPGEASEWEQFQFAKRIEWKALPAIIDGKGKKEKEDAGIRSDVCLDRPGLDQMFGSSSVEPYKKGEDSESQVTVDRNFDEAGVHKADPLNELSTTKYGNEEARPFDSHDEVAQLSSIDSFKSSPLSAAVSAPTNLSDSSTSPGQILESSEQVGGAHALLPYINKLHASERYSEVPPAFESMVKQGIRPTTEAYNALLAAAINVSKDKHQVVPTALDVYSDMLRRKVLPDTAFYTTLIQLLSRRAIDVFAMKASLDRKRSRFGGFNTSEQFLFRSNEAEYDILAEDDALTNAMRLFDSSVGMLHPRTYSPETYRLLVTACAVHNRVDDMIRAYSHMESHNIVPIARMFPPMIEAFALSGDLSSAVDCYNEYKSLAIADDAGKVAIISREDSNVYAAVVKAYALSGNPNGGSRFYTKIINSFDHVTDARKQKLAIIQDAVILNGLIQHHLDTGNFPGALTAAEDSSLTAPVRSLAMARICAAAADHGEVDIATKSYGRIGSVTTETKVAAVAILALHIRQGNVDKAREFWTALSPTELGPPMIEPTVMYAIALIGSGHIDEGLLQARQAFSHIRMSIGSSSTGNEIAEQIDEGIELIGTFLADKSIVPSSHASVNFLWAMIENGGLVSPVAEQLLAGIGPENSNNLSWQDLILTLQIEAEMVGNGKALCDVAHSTRFAYLLEAAMSSSLPLGKRTSDLIEFALGKLAPPQPELLLRWQTHHQVNAQQASNSVVNVPPDIPGIVVNNPHAESFDPHGATTDHKGSALITDQLDTHKSKANAGLSEALKTFNDIRHTGRHPRYIVYAKLITAAAKGGRTNLVHDILGKARQDVPFLPGYTVVRHGWAAILDAMVGACLTMGKRTLAAQSHQELLSIGAAPTANTFGLYITTLKESTKTSDEATEALKIFLQAKSEGVEPSSFLYNALIGKLGKARRIDDCLLYFREMRTLGIRPTSVTYGTIVNALCRVSDERYAEEMFDEMESMPNYKPRPAPYNSLMQFFLTTKRDSAKVLAYYERMQSKGIEATMHTYKLLIDTYATLDPIDLAAAEGVLETIRASGKHPEAVHYASLIHAKGCALHDMAGARQVFDEVLSKGEIRPQACLYQALFESMVANHCVTDTEEILENMSAKRVELTPYIANTLIHGWALVRNIAKSKAIYESVNIDKREPSTYQAIIRAFLTVEDRDSAMETVHEMMSRGYPSAVSNKVLELLGHDQI
jgi:pentatricopeptide repeat protein